MCPTLYINGLEAYYRALIFYSITDTRCDRNVPQPSICSVGLRIYGLIVRTINVSIGFMAADLNQCASWKLFRIREVVECDFRFRGNLDLSVDWSLHPTSPIKARKPGPGINYEMNSVIKRWKETNKSKLDKSRERRTMRTVLSLVLVGHCH